MTQQDITFDMLNDDQRKAHDGIVDLFENSYPAVAILTGPAGTGKTAVCKFLYDALDPELSAMTHKAAAVMHKATGKNVKTLAKVLKQSKYNDLESGEVHFRTKGEVELEKNTRTLFIDEASMTNEENYDQVLKALAMNYNILFIGDEFQLPPVNEEHSKALAQDVPHFKLRQIMRSKEGSGIQRVSISIRDSLEAGMEEIEGMRDILDQHDDVQWIRERDAFPMMVEEFKKAESADDVRMISFTNARVEQFNYHLKLQVTGDAEKFKEGDLLMANAAFAPKYQQIVDDDGNMTNDYTKRVDDGVVLQNNESVRIESIREGTLLDQKIWIVDTEEYKNLPVPQDRMLVERVIKELGKQARLQPQGSVERRDKFSLMFEYIESFCDLRLNYAQTVHKSQGSTYKVCFFDLTSLNSATEMGKKLLYTGVTRASEKLILFR